MRYTYAGEKGEKVVETIWKPIGGLVLLKEIANFSMLNAILGYCDEGGVCQIM